jgi:muramoyltetrapeptide carboxypeptidase
MLFIVLLLCFSTTVNAQRLPMPPALKAGDTIAIVSPSSQPDSMTVVKGCEVFRE